MSTQTITEIPFQDLNRLHGSIERELSAAIADVIARSGFVGAGSCRVFEEAFANAHHAAHAVGVGSGTDALALALRAVGIGSGHEVIVPAMTFVATAEAVVHVGAVPVMADVDPHTLLLDPASVDAVRTDRTAAVIPVHLFGHIVPFEWIEAWQASGLRVIEDAAQAHLGTWRGATGRLGGRRRLFQLLSREEPGCVRRRWSRHHQGRKNCCSRRQAP